jgi:hypothetical protein
VGLKFSLHHAHWTTHTKGRLHLPGWGAFSKFAQRFLWGGSGTSTLILPGQISGTAFRPVAKGADKSLSTSGGWGALSSYPPPFPGELSKPRVSLELE